jgi:actin-related protein
MPRKKKPGIEVAVVPNIDEEKKLAKREAAQLSPLVQEVSAMKPRKPEDYELLNDYGRRIKSAKDAVTAREKKPLALVKALQAEVKSWFKPFHKTCDDARTLVEEKLDEYEEYQEELARKAREDAERKAEAKRKRLLKKSQKATSIADKRKLKEQARDVEVEETEGPDIFKVEGASRAFIWDLVVHDENKVPEHFLRPREVDRVKCLDFIREHATEEMERVAESNPIGHVEVPGVSFFKKKSRRFSGL